jgi:hypothetical protein
MTEFNLSYLKLQSALCSKHAASVIKTNQLMQYTKINAVFSESHTKHTCTFGAEGRIFES